LAKSSQRDEAVKLLEQLKAESARRYVPNLSFALVYAALGEKGEAFVWKKISPHVRFPQRIMQLMHYSTISVMTRRAALAKMD
jgi:hypothetical protein